jgi:hypothetical protein
MSDTDDEGYPMSDSEESDSEDEVEAVAQCPEDDENGDNETKG